MDRPEALLDRAQEAMAALVDEGLPDGEPVTCPQGEQINLDRELRAAGAANWKAIVAQYEKPHAGRASWQIVNTIDE